MKTGRKKSLTKKINDVIIKEILRRKRVKNMNEEKVYRDYVNVFRSFYGYSKSEAEKVAKEIIEENEQQS